MNTVTNQLDLVVDAVVVFLGIFFSLAIGCLFRERRARARKRAEPKLIALSYGSGGVRPHGRLAQQGEHSRSRA